VYALKGRNSMLWVRDRENTWMAELRAGRAPDLLKGVRVDAARLGEFKRARVYDPWRGGKWRKVGGRRGMLELPPFRRSLVIRLESR
jgi:hypothetical protein